MGGVIFYIVKVCIKKIMFVMFKLQEIQEIFGDEQKGPDGQEKRITFTEYLKRVNARLSGIKAPNTSGQEISDAAQDHLDRSLTRYKNKAGITSNTLLTDNKTNIYTGPKAFVSRTNASGMNAYGMQGRNIVTS